MIRITRGVAIVIKPKHVQIILLAEKEGWGIKILKILRLVRITDYGRSKLIVFELRVLSFD